MKTILIQCRFEGHILGKIEIEEKIWEKRHPGVILTLENMGIEDSRCDSCNTDFGVYKQMQRDFTSAGGSIEQFSEHMKKNDYKNTKLKNAILNLQERKNPEAKR